MLQLTSQNYHSNEANQAYMSHSVYKDFITCEAMAMAKLTGAWQEPPSEALLVGSYVHAAIEGTLEEFKVANPDLFTKKGELRSEFKNADLMVETLRNDEFMMFVLEGQHEVIITAEFAGAMWKAKMDVYKPDERIADLKTVKSIRDKHWDKRYGYVSFVESFGYLRQLSLYAELERRWSGRDTWLEPLLVAVSKEDPPDKEIIGIDDERMYLELEEIKQNMPRILQVKSGLVSPNRCESCKYCRATKKVSHVVHFAQLLA